MRLEWAELSLVDLEKIRDCIAKASASYAARFIVRIIEAAESRLRLPLMGRLVPEAVSFKEKLNRLRKSGAKEDAVTACRESVAAAERAAREAQAKADAIDAAVYDLKAVNPRARIERDTRTPAEIIESIAIHGRTVENALARLRKLIRRGNA